MNEMDCTDTHFRVVRGLADPNHVSIESLKWPGNFLRHRGPGKRVELSNAWWDPWFRGDATFVVHVNRFEALYSRGHYLRQAGDQLLLSRIDPYDGSAYTTLFEPRRPISLGRSLQWGLGMWRFRAGEGTLEAWSTCTGITAFGVPQRTSIVATTLTTGRIVWSAAASTPYMGFYPKLTFTGREEYLEDIHTIRREMLPCAW
jgi:hypothetical protein